METQQLVVYVTFHLGLVDCYKMILKDQNAAKDGILVELLKRPSPERENISAVDVPFPRDLSQLRDSLKKLDTWNKNRTCYQKCRRIVAKMSNADMFEFLRILSDIKKTGLIKSINGKLRETLLTTSKFYPTNLDIRAQIDFAMSCATYEKLQSFLRLVLKDFHAIYEKQQREKKFLTLPTMKGKENSNSTVCGTTGDSGIATNDMDRSAETKELKLSYSSPNKQIPLNIKTEKNCEVSKMSTSNTNQGSSAAKSPWKSPRRSSRILRNSRNRSGEENISKSHEPFQPSDDGDDDQYCKIIAVVNNCKSCEIGQSKKQKPKTKEVWVSDSKESDVYDIIDLTCDNEDEVLQDPLLKADVVVLKSTDPIKNLKMDNSENEKQDICDNLKVSLGWFEVVVLGEKKMNMLVNKYDVQANALNVDVFCDNVKLTSTFVNLSEN